MCKMKQTHYIRCLIVNNTFHDQLPVSFCGSLFSEDQVLCSTNVQSQSHGIYTEPTKENYTGVETTPFWNYFFCRFFLRLREGINGKKTFSFGHCPNHLNPPPLTPIRATWSFFSDVKIQDLKVT